MYIFSIAGGMKIKKGIKMKDFKDRCYHTEQLEKYERETEAKELAYTKNYERFIDDIELPVGLITDNIEIIRTIGKEYNISDEDIEEAILDSN